MKKIKRATKNSLTLASRRALNSLSNIGRELEQVDNFDLGQIRQSSPPNSYMMEIGQAHRQLESAFNAVRLAYVEIRKIARKAGEPVV